MTTVLSLNVSDALVSLIDYVGKANMNKGFHGPSWHPEAGEGVDSNYVVTKTALAMGELSEAIEEIRSGHSVYEVYYREDGKPEGYLVELADAVVRIFDAVSEYGAAEQFVLALDDKLQYNATRPHKHGKAF